MNPATLSTPLGALFPPGTVAADLRGPGNPDLLLPADLVPKQSVVATNVATLSPQPELNFEER